LNDAEWTKLKRQGSNHYKTGRTEPIDLYLAGDMFQDFALCSIIKYAFRSRQDQYLDVAKFNSNMDKIIDYAKKLKAFYGDPVMP
jgi:hypothetical protein